MPEILLTVQDKKKRNVDAKTLVDSSGNDVINPATGKAYIVPRDYSVGRALAIGYQLRDIPSLSSSFRGDIAFALLFVPGGLGDLQRSYNGKAGGGYDEFVSDFTDAASLNLGIIGAAAGYSADKLLIGGGLLNKLQDSLENLNPYDKHDMDSSGEYGNNPHNVADIRLGVQIVKSGRLKATPQPSLPSLPKCFQAGTLILLSDGSQKPIEDIKIGDEILAFHEFGQLVPRRVTQLFQNVTDEWIELSNGIRVTPGHHFLALDGSFKSIKEILETDKRVVGVDGQIIEVTGRFIRAKDIQKSSENFITNKAEALSLPRNFDWITYNFAVEELHTYIAGGIRVHNLSLPDHILPGSKILLAYQLPDGTQVAFAESPNSEFVTYIVKDIDGDGNTNLLRTIATFDDRETAIIRDEIYDGQGNLTERDFNVKFADGTDIGQQIGNYFGSSLGQAINSDNIFADIATDSVLSAVLGNVGDSLHIYFRGTKVGLAENAGTLTFLESVEAGFDSFADDLFNEIKSGGISAVSSFLVAELSDALDIGNSFGGQLFNTAAGAVTSTLIFNAIDSKPLFDGLLTYDKAGSLNGGAVISSVGSFLGSYLANEIIAPQSTSGALGGSIGGSLGGSIGAAIAGVKGVSATIGSTVLNTLGLSSAINTFTSSIAGLILPGIGVLVGTLVGTLLGDWINEQWGDEARAWASLELDSTNGKFYLSDTWRKEGGNKRFAIEMAEASRDTLNSYLDIIGGVHIMTDNLYHRYGHREKKLYVNFRDALHGNNEIKRSTPEGIIDLGVIDTLKRLRLAGGDVLMKRVIEKTQSKTVKELNGDLQIAQDYARYLENKDVIDLMIASAPNSAFAAGWVITLIRAEEIGITDWSKSDFYGGLAVFFESFGLDKTGASLDNLNISVDGATLKLEVIIDDKVVRTIEIADIENKIGYKYLSANATGATVNGTAGNDIWIAQNIASTFIDSDIANDGESNDILVGGSGNDSINAGLGWDFVRGNGGNDLIVGSAGNDALYGADGDDIIYGDENAGFAAIPTDIEISDSAADNAKPVSDNTRQTWFSSATNTQLVFRNDEVHGGADSDSIAGGEGNDHLFGDADSDKLYGDAGNDRLEGGNDADILYGGVGYDAVSYANATAGVTVDLAGGTFKGTASGDDQLYSIEDIIGSAFGDTLKGDAYANIIDGGMGDDTLDGRGGRDAVSFFSSAYGVEINLKTGIAVTKTGETSSDTDTLLNIEDAIASTHDDTLIGSTLGGGLDGDAGNDTIIIHNDDVDVANGAATYDVHAGEGVDNLSFANWDKLRGVEINLNGSESGHSFSSIEKVIGSAKADSITGSAKAEIFDGSKGDDVFSVSEGRDVYLLNRESGNEQLRQTVVQKDLDQTSEHGTIKVNNPEYQQLYPSLKDTTVELKVNYKDSISYGRLPNEDESISPQQSIVFGEDITYHDIYGSLKAINPNSIDLAYERYFTNGYPSDSVIITKQELIDLLDSIDLTIGIKSDNTYITNSQAILSQLTDTITIQGGGLLPDKDSNNLSWVGFSEEDYDTKNHRTRGSNTFAVTHQGTEYNFGTNQLIERLGFADSGHIELGQIKYFKDGSADVDTLVADTDKATWLYGGDANDTIKGSEQADVLIGGKNNDLLQGNEGDDQYAYWLGDGYDIINDQLGIDTVVFGGGITFSDIKFKVGKLDDSANYKSFREILPGEVSPDLKIEIYNPETKVQTGSITVIDFQDLANFKDKLRFAGDYEVSIFELLKQSGDKRLPTLTGTTGNDTLTGSEVDEAFFGLAGNDTVRGNDGDDIFYAHGGADNIDGDDGSDTLDYRYATNAVSINFDNERAVESANVTDKFNSIENAVGSDFDDTIIGNSGDNILIGHAGNDVINGEKGNDRLFGDSGDDLIQGDRGDDLLNGDAGNDTLTGGTGRDRFSFTQPSYGIDTLTDFSVEDDLMEISASGFNNNLAFGQLDIGQFTLGTQASTNAHRFIYNGANGDLLFDSDGKGTISATKFATLNPNLALTHQHFVVV